MSAGGSKFELDDRSYLREKVIEVYEKLWLRGAPLDASGWAELFFLKPNAAWLQSYLGSLTAARLRASTPTVRALWAECAARLGHEHEPSVRGHALETMSGILLGLGGVPLHSFASDAPELLTGLDEAEGCFDELAPMLRELLAPPSAAAAASPSAALTAIALRRSALRLLMAFALASDGLSANILLEFLLLRLASSEKNKTSASDGDEKVNRPSPARPPSRAT
ncbi:hypothetical protein EMIHUDRAFT_223662 [Emiliania huxleyi CCMP1516]|uniref:Proteasome activator Blm10 mid region domain-containing protein n=2 Tax=Emiliania huxleyi TaxID=2903 RepID=A0A0D3KTU7_EMIH1|nr:hypothetical protein EMIHUDRAFT_223662 [Emiliania huxleyi CCMP1516]EOD39182.1 hypothetical protein EMIHUDRAFT_223662 [Emiliania huxleyi CCMP1516]|eukprot:XP_005791611.1 hypothetical protein EMIHUDRAFT_223662 [Emiliania huxleyi CCMP1516]